MCYFSNIEQNRMKRRMHGMFLLSDPGCSVPKFVDDLFRVVRKQKRLGFIFTYVILNVLTVTSQVGCCLQALDEGISFPVFFLVWNSTIVINFYGLIICPFKIWRVQGGLSSQVLNIGVCIHLSDEFLPWPQKCKRMRGEVGLKQIM